MIIIITPTSHSARTRAEGTSLTPGPVILSNCWCFGLVSFLDRFIFVREIVVFQRSPRFVQVTMRNRNLLHRDEILDDDDQVEESSFLLKVGRNDVHRNISCEELLALNPTKSGYCQKKNNSALAYFFPCLFPKWKSRYFVLVGNYLFRFSSERGETLKGVPIPLDSVTVTSLGDDCFQVSTIRKVYTMKVESQVEVVSWINAINTRKHQAIRESMGHAATSIEVKRANKVGIFLFNERLQGDRDIAAENARTPYPMSGELT